MIGAIATLVLGLTAAQPAPQVSLAELQRHEKFFTSQESAGRMTLSKGLQHSQDYVIRELKKMGVQPMRGSYTHSFQVRVNPKIGPNTKLNITGSDGKVRTLVVGKEFSPVANSNPTPVEGKLVFAGFGTEAEYKNLDVKGKIVLLFRGSAKKEERFTTVQKSRIAKAMGAAGILFVGPHSDGSLDVPTTGSAQGLERGSTLAAAGVTQNLAQTFFGKSFAAERANPSPRALDVRVSLRTELTPYTDSEENVIAMIPGNDPKLSYEYIIIGAHLDHLGYAETSSRTGNEFIHHGADDNGSGSAAILEMARYYAKTKSNRRTLIFQWYSGEELGLLGAEAWARDNPRILSKTQMMLNLDMVGRLRKDELTLYGTSTAQEMESLVATSDWQGLKLIKIPGSPSNSDHAVFYQRGVPVLFANTGLHEEYHTEKDTYETINYPGMVVISNALISLLNRVDSMERLKFVRVPTQSNRDTGPRRIRIGFIPDMSGVGPGMLVNGTIENSPAAKAGVKAGDRLMRLGGMEIKDIEDLQEAMSKAEPGKPMEAVLMRDGKEVKVTIIPEGPVSP
jgi:aminopeptidase YwaD